MFYLYRASIFIDVGLQILTIASSPRTFGIKYGSLVMCFILTANGPAHIIFLLVKPNPILIYSIGLVFCIASMLICLLCFRETLDINFLIKKRLVIFEDFGLKMGSENLNYSKKQTATVCSTVNLSLNESIMGS